jgi:hypothetical protein
LEADALLKGNWLARPGDRSGDIWNALLLPGEEQRHERERERELKEESTQGGRPK